MRREAGTRAENQARARLLDRVFLISILLKGLDGLIELLGGVLLFIVTPAQLYTFVQLLTRHALAQDPDEFLATSLLQLTGHLTAAVSLFAALYLLAHGVVKILLVWALLTGRLWAYPWMIVFLLIFVAYQSYRMVLAPSAWLGLLTAFDLFVAWLTWLEYRRHRSRGQRLPLLARHHS